MKVKLIIILALILTSCSKDCPIDQPTRTELLTSNEWIGVSLKEYVNNVEDDSEDLSNKKFVFLINGDYLIYENDLPSNVEQWELVNNQQEINLVNGVFKIEALSETSLVFYQEEVQGTDTIKVEVSFKR